MTAVIAALAATSPARPAPPQGTPGNQAPFALETITPPPFCAGPLTVQGVGAFVCEFPVNWVFDEASLSQFATSAFGVTIQAAGGNGGDGGSSLGGTVGAGAGGQPGLAQTTLRGDALAGKSLYIYVGNSGGFGASGKGGNGGAATVVGTQPLTPTPSGVDGILLAAGGGGGGQGYDGSDPTCVPTPITPINQDAVNCDGGGGGVAIAIDAQNRIGTRFGAQLPTYSFTQVSNMTSGKPPYFDAGAWVGGPAGTGGTAGSGAFSFAGSAAEGSPASGTWVRDNAALTLGPARVLGGNGKGSGGAGGGGVAGGGGAGNGGGAGGASFAVGSGYGLPTGTSFPLPCNPTGFCATNWLSPAGTDQPAVVITFWQIGGADPLIPADGETIDTDQPSLVFEGADASAGVHYLIEGAGGQVNVSALTSGSATGNLLWTVPAGLLEEGQTYDWSVTDQTGTSLQDPRLFTIATGASSGLAQGWTLYVRSMDGLDSSLPTSLQPLGNQPVPTVSTSCSCLCTETLAATAPSLPTQPLDDSSGYPSCSDFIPSDSAGCDCTWSASGQKPTDSSFWQWALASGTGCTASSGSCYANAQIQTGTIDIDWSSPSNPLGLLVPSRLINLTSEPAPVAGGATTVPSLAVPAIAGFSGSCADPSQVEVTFTARTNGGVRFQIYANPTSGAPTSSPASAIENWDIPSCSWTTSKTIDTASSDYYSNAYLEAQVYQNCQASPEEKTGNQSFCLNPGQAYRVRLDAVQPYLPGPMELGFKLAGMDSGAPIPANWISTCTLDSTTGNCDLALAVPDGPPGHGRRPPHAGRPDNPGRPIGVGPPAHAGKPANPGRPVRPGPGLLLLDGEDGTAGASSCKSAGSTVSCTWRANGTWQLPAVYTQPGGWVTVQALGGAGGAGYPPAINLGGAGGRAQTVLPAEALAGETLYVYVGANGAAEENYDCNGQPDYCFNSATGGAASLVTTAPVPDSFVSAGCEGTAEGLDALVIAAGGGAGGINGNVSTVPSIGGDGGIAVGGSGAQNVVGSGTAGTADPTSSAGQSPLYGSNPYDGTQTVRGGVGTIDPTSYDLVTDVYFGGGAVALGGGGEYQFADTWFANTSFLTLPVAHQQGCSGGQNIWGGSGGGGHAAGGGGASIRDTDDAGNPGWELMYGAGGGGGSSWAAGAGAGVTLPPAFAGWQTLASNDPSQVVISVQCPSCAFLTDCAMQSTPQRPVMRCTLSQSASPLSLEALVGAVAAEIGQDVSDDVPVYLEAWGGSGGQGGQAINDCLTGPGGNGGNSGYARTSFTVGDLFALSQDMWIYVGANGEDGSDKSTSGCTRLYGMPGAGGSSSLILTSSLVTDLGISEVLAIAAGSGGGGGGYAATNEGAPGGIGRDGRGAIATISGSASVGGVGGISANGDGKGACGSTVNDTCGTDGIGGKGGGVENGAATTSWIGSNVSWSQGLGGLSPGGNQNGGAGGGGFGGGQAGQGSGSSKLNVSEGGGAGGSYARQATIADGNAPVLGEANPPTSDSGVVVISFDVCSTDPTLAVCQP
jgi:hypothetical protein